MSLLSVENLTLSFGGVVALSEVSLDVPKAQILGIIGPNGAGKTTLLNAICGIQQASHGRVVFGGQDITGRRPDQVAALGLARTFQSSRLFHGMSVLENMMCGLHTVGHANFAVTALQLGSGRREEREMRDRAMRALEYVGFERFADRPGSALSFGQQRIVEIARALASEPKLVLLDEPAVGLSVPRIEELDRFLRKARDEMGVTFIMIEHVIRLVMGVSDRIIVMNAGTKIADGSPQSVRSHETVVEAYLGKGAYAERVGS